MTLARPFCGRYKLNGRQARRVGVPFVWLLLWTPSKERKRTMRSRNMGGRRTAGIFMAMMVAVVALFCAGMVEAAAKRLAVRMGPAVQAAVQYQAATLDCPNCGGQIDARTGLHVSGATHERRVQGPAFVDPFRGTVVAAFDEGAGPSAPQSVGSEWKPDYSPQPTPAPQPSPETQKPSPQPQAQTVMVRTYQYSAAYRAAPAAAAVVPRKETVLLDLNGDGWSDHHVKVRR